ncbi:MAG: hypothetical protein IPN81_02050 [Nitrosomonadales bacterium]|jgi:hypothetical protein|nr:hypothetical protein [Nitrosomonadales bacterium]
MKDMPILGLPLILLGALWGAVSIVLQSYQMINAKRDQIMVLIECKKAFAGKLTNAGGDFVAVPAKVLDQCHACCYGKELQPMDLYLSNLLPLSLGLCLFLAIVSFAVVCIPGYLNSGDADFMRRVRRISWITASLPLFSLFAFAVGTLFDGYTFLFKLGDWVLLK